MLLEYLVECQALYKCYFIHLRDPLPRMAGILLLMQVGKVSCKGQLSYLKRKSLHKSLKLQLEMFFAPGM